MFCTVEGCGRPAENREKGLCSTHARQQRKAELEGVKQKEKPKRIKSASAKKLKEIDDYVKASKTFLSKPENKICKVCGKPGADSIHHAKGKVGFADNEARLNGITLLMDERYWVPIHSYWYNPDFGASCHRYIEDRPELARELGVTKSRLGND